MSNIIRFKNFKNNTKPLPTDGTNKVYSLYHELIASGFSSCVAYHEAMKLLIFSNPFRHATSSMRISKLYAINR